MRKWISIFLGSAVLGSLGDSAHVHAQVDGYPSFHPLIPILNVPYWVPLEFGFAGFLIAWLQPKIDRMLGRPPRETTKRKKWLAIGGFFVLYLASAFMPLATPGPKDAFMAIGGLAVWKLCDGKIGGIADAVLCAVVGCLVEIVLVKLGVFFYYPGFSQLAGVPSWLPWLYLAASVAGGSLGATVTGESLVRIAAKTQ